MRKGLRKDGKPKNKPISLSARKDRAEFFFRIYEALGPNRSIRRLFEVVGEQGIAVKTLEHYSHDFGWQRRLLETAGKREQALQLEAVGVVDQMNKAHADYWQGVFAVARGGLSFYQAKIEEQKKAGIDPTLEMSIQDMVHLGEAAQRGERLARGVATSKVEVIMEVVAPLVKELMAVFLAVNVITNDPVELVNKRQAEFVKRGDGILATYYEPTKKMLVKGGE